jgi:hypothetical protein
MSDAAARSTSFDSRPVPDPTILTTEALIREIAHLRELLETQIEGLGDACESKFVHIEQRFERQFRDRDLLVDAAFQSSREAVAAALAASKEAVAKSEDTFNKQIAEIRRTAEATSKGLEKEIGGIKDRVTIMESIDRGSERKAAGLNQAAVLVISALLLILTGIGVVAAIVGTRPG